MYSFSTVTSLECLIILTALIANYHFKVVAEYQHQAQVHPLQIS